MHPELRQSQTPLGSEPAPAMLLPAVSPIADDLGGKRAAQQLLFARTPRSVCAELGLNWWSAAKLHEEGWLSFSPEKTLRLDESQEMELRFLGALVAAGCDRGMLTSILGGLPRPYAYNLGRVYYDWCSRAWRMLPDLHAHPEARFSNWVEILVKSGDIETLKGILELAGDALARVRSCWPQPELYRVK